MEATRDFMIDLVEKEKLLPFEKMIERCENRIHAIFMFLSLLELVQQRYMNILVGEGKNNFVLEYNTTRTDDLASLIKTD
jgi:segregation and condensation protein A